MREQIEVEELGDPLATPDYERLYRHFRDQAHIQASEDGVWIHLHANGQHFSLNLSHQPIAAKLCAAYRASLVP